MLRRQNTPRPSSFASISYHDQQKETAGRLSGRAQGPIRLLFSSEARSGYRGGLTPASLPTLVELESTSAGVTVASAPPLRLFR